MISVGSLFSGIGGIELGLERSGGFKTIWFVENEPYCQAVLRKHWPKVPIYGDIKEINFRKLPHVDMLTGGFPCQDISIAGKGEGISGKRSGLWTEYARAIRKIRPRYALIENVPALLSRGIDTVLRDLAEAGYDAEWFTLCASDFGALHRRERIFIVAYPDSFGHERGDKKEHRKSQDGPEIQGRNIPHIITNLWNERIQGFKQKSLSGKQGFSWCEDVGRIEDLQNRQDIPEPLFCGSRDGVSNFVDRLKCIGNAVVPQVAEFIGEQIMECYELKK